MELNSNTHCIAEEHIQVVAQMTESNDPNTRILRI